MEVTRGGERIVVFGHGGLAKRIGSLVMDLQRHGSNIDFLGYLSRDVREASDALVIGDDTHMAALDAHYVVGIGTPGIRRRLDEYALSLGKKPATLVHLGACLETPVQIGPGCIVLFGACIETDATIGRQVLVNVNAVIGHDVVVEDYSVISPLALVGGGGRIGAGSFLGAGAKVLPGVSVGDRAVVGAGSVVTKDVPDHTRAVGLPARHTAI